MDKQANSQPIATPKESTEQINPLYFHNNKPQTPSFFPPDWANKNNHSKQISDSDKDELPKPPISTNSDKSREYCIFLMEEDGESTFQQQHPIQTPKTKVSDDKNFWRNLSKKYINASCLPPKPHPATAKELEQDRLKIAQCLQKNNIFSEERHIPINESTGSAITDEMKLLFNA